MADCSRNFKDGKDSYLEKISLGSKKEAQLRKSRDGLRERIRGHLNEKGAKNIRFYRQGSYAHRTIINPLNGDYDIDDGVYMDLSEFEEEPSTTSIHNWIKEAVKGYTEKDPQDKEACVRAIFKAGYHADLPAYKVEVDEDDNEEYLLAKKTTGWEASNPRGMTDWFQGQVQANSEQVRRLVKYFKGWQDFRNTKISTKLPNGLTLTILACEEYQSDIRDDIAFHETVKAILERLEKDEAIWKPYKPTENMRDSLSNAQFKKFLSELEKLIETGDKAIKEESTEKAAKEWQKVLGDRFPVFEDTSGKDKSNGNKFIAPAILGTTVRSA